MTAEELIIGHYEKTLTSDQESRLASMIASSPEVRTLYEQHGNIEALMVEEAESIDTSSKLDKVVIGAALGTLAEIAGQGVGISLLGKVATVVGTLAVGGAGFFLYNAATDDDPAAAQPAVRPSPTVTTPTSPQLDQPTQTRTEAPATNAAPSSTDAASSGPNATTTTPRNPAVRDRAAASGDRAATTTDSRSGSNAQNSLDLNTDAPEATVKHKPEVRQQDSAQGRK